MRFGVTRHPTAEWVASQVTEAFPWDTPPQYLICDRDGVYGHAFLRHHLTLTSENAHHGANFDESDGEPDDFATRWRRAVNSNFPGGDFRARPLSLRKPKIKTGTVLIREWQGKNHRVTAAKEGFIYGGKHGSLSQIARMPRMRFLLFKDLCASRNSPEGF